MNQKLKRSIIILKKEEYEKRETADADSRLFLYHIHHYQYCKAEFHKSCIFGTIVLPDKAELVHREICFAFCLKAKELLFVDDTGTAEQIIEEMKKDYPEENSDPERFFYDFMEYMMRDEIGFLQAYEEEMTDMEESLMHYEGEDLSGMIIRTRKELLRLQSCYHQLMDMSEVLRENDNGMLSQETCCLFEQFSHRMERIAAISKDLREYSLQIRELYQTQISMRQNKVMQLLTVVTTIFMPLTLLTGWYGMNFQSMPEISWKYGYGVVIGISLLVVTAEIWYFKKRKWFL